MLVLERTANPTGLRAALLPLGMALLLVGAAQSVTHAAAEARSPGGWTQVPSPNRGVAVNELKAVAVLGRSNAWAVGFWTPPTGVNRTLIQHWDGASWTVVPSPNSGLGDNELTAVSAVAPDDVWAVGRAHEGAWAALILHWDGDTWGVVPSPDPGPGDEALEGLVARGPDDVWAVGGQGPIDPSGSLPRTLIERWEGESWEVVPSPNPGQGSEELSAITAVPRSEQMWAVGARTVASHRIFTARWDGVSWAAVLGPALRRVGGLSGVAAVGPHDVFAVGNVHAHALAVRWNGTKWRQTLLPPVGGVTRFLAAARLPGRPGVVAVGWHDLSSLVERWDGTRWVILDGKDVLGDRNELAGVAFPAPGVVWAVGDASGKTLVERWRGFAPSRLTSPNLGHGNDSLSAVAASSPHEAWAVGRFSDGTALRGLVEHWDGKSWRVIPSPNAPLPLDALEGVAVVSATDVWAVGETGGFGQQTLIEHWNGFRWSIVHAPEAWGMQAVDATPGKYLWAAGGLGNPTAERFDGTRWVDVPTPDLDTLGPSLFDAVAAPSVSNVWAGGRYSGGATVPLIEHWNDARWHLFFPDSSEGSIAGMASRSKSDVWAVGFAGDPPYEPARTLAMHWNGSGWSVVSTADPGTENSQFNSVTTAPGADAWAVGDAGSTALVERWHEGSWSIVPSPAPGTTSALNGVAGVPDTDNLWAVGSFSDGGTTRTLVEFRAGPYGPTGRAPSR